MKFKEAFELMKQGHKVKLPSWGGYWFWDNEKQTVMMKCRSVDSETSKDLLDIRETQRVEYTLENIMSDEWIEATGENCTVLGGQPTFGFDEAVKYLKRGLKLSRKSWQDSKLHIVLSSNNYIDLYKDKSLVIGTFIASQDDVLADDWCFFNDL